MNLIDFCMHIDSKIVELDEKIEEMKSLLGLKKTKALKAKEEKIPEGYMTPRDFEEKFKFISRKMIYSLLSLYPKDETSIRNGRHVLVDPKNVIKLIGKHNSARIKRSLANYMTLIPDLKEIVEIVKEQK